MPDAPPQTKRSKQTQARLAVAQTRPTPTVKPFFQQTALCISSSSLLKTRQQYRYEELERVLGAILPTKLFQLIDEYAAEASFSPFAFDSTRAVIDNAGNKKIFEDIAGIFRSTEPGFERLQQDIIEHHGRKLLDPMFKKAIATLNKLNTLGAMTNNDQAALKKRQDVLLTITNFVPHSELEKNLDDELDRAKQTSGNREVVEAMRPVNIRLLIEALKNADPRFDKAENRLDALAGKEAQFFVKRAQSHLNEQQFQKAVALSLKALAIFCRLNKKRDVISVVTQLIQWSNRGQQDRCGEILNLFAITKPLCLKYPADHDLYANLLFAVDDYCHDRSENVVLKQIYAQAQSDGLPDPLPCSHRAEFLYRQIRANHRVGATGPTVMQQINSALEYCYSVVARVILENELSDPLRTRYFCAFAMLYRTAAQITERHIRDFAQMSKAQREQSGSLIKYDQGFEAVLTDFRFDDYPSLMHQHPVCAPSSRARLVSVASAYYKCALKAMMQTIVYSTATPATVKLFVNTFADLVNFYCTSKNTQALEQLLLKRNVKNFVHHDAFKEQLPAWRNLLKKSKKARRT